jgi:hypothetical protein
MKRSKIIDEFETLSIAKKTKKTKDQAIGVRER